MEKSHVSMETNRCVVCAQEYDTGAILLDKRMKQSMEHKTCTGWGMCEEHAKLRADGYIALVSCDESKSNAQDANKVQPYEAYRLGEIAHIRAHVFKEWFDVPVPKGGVCFCDPEVIEHLKAIPVKD